MEYLSPTSVSLFYKDRAEFYLSYLADQQPPKIPQSKPMAVGAATDAYLKAYIAEKLFGTEMADEFQLDAIFEAQVEPHNRDWAREHGKYVFDCYKISGALADLMLELQHALEAPRLEFKIQNRIPHEAHVEGIPLLGKPDIFYINRLRMHVIYDFKVNGYCGKSPTSPKPNYLICRDGWGGDTAPASRSHLQMHKNCEPMEINGLLMNIGHYLDDIDLHWARQLAIYGWVLGESVGSQFGVGIEQMVSGGTTGRELALPLIRVASHRCRINKIFQDSWFDEIQDAWKIIQSGHIFDDLDREDSDARCKMLDDYHKAFSGDTPKDKWFQSVTRGQHSDY
jgi:hypothetical protein